MTKKKNMTDPSQEAKVQPQTGVVGCNFMEIVEDSMLNGGVKKAISELEKLAEAGNADAAYFLAECYLKGNVFPASDDKGAKYLVLAAKLGNTKALVRLGGIGFHNAESEEEKEEVLSDFRKAAFAGHPEAEFIVAAFYEMGYGCKVNKKMAALWGLKASIDHCDRGVVKEILDLHD